MNGNNRDRASNKRHHRTIKVAPTTRAIRAALALSATMLALAGSGSAFAAGSCTAPVSETVTCNGTFNDDVTNYATVYADLTLIVGTDGTTTVDPADGVNGISSYWGGDATVINYGDVSVSNADGIHMGSGVYATVENYGGIIAVGTTADVYGVFASGDEGATVVNGGNVIAGVSAGLPYDATGVHVYSWDGTSTVTNTADGSIHASAGDGTGIGIYASGWDGSSVTNDGFVSGTSFTGSAIGIDASSDVGTVDVYNNGTIEAYSLDGFSIGITASGSGDTYVYSSGPISTGGAGAAGGIHAYSSNGTATIYNTGDITVTSYTSSAIGASAYGKYADVTNTGTIDVNAYSGGTGINAIGANGANIDNSGTINVNVYGFGGDAVGISVQGNGYINITNDGDINVVAAGDGSGPATLLPYSEGADGIGISGVVHYYSEGGGGGGQGLVQAQLLYGPFDVNEVNNGNVYVSALGNGYGIYGATFGAGSVYESNTNSVAVYAGNQATGMLGYSNVGTIELDNSGTVTTGADSYSTGMAAESHGSYGHIYVDNSGTLDGYSYFAAAGGIVTQATGYEADTTVDNSGSIYAGANDYAVGIRSRSYGDFGNITVDSSGTIDVYAYNNGATGIEVEDYSYYGEISVTNSGSISVESNYGSAEGIFAKNDADGGGVFVDNQGTISANGDSYAAGIIAWGYGYYDTTVYNSGSLSAYSESGAATGIYAWSDYENVVVDSSGTISVDGYGFSQGILAYTDGDGNVDVTTAGSITVTSRDDTAYGVRTYSNGDGNLTVGNDADISVVADNGDAYGIYAYAFGNGNVSVTNSGSIYVGTSSGEANGIYTWADGDGNSVVDNSGTLDVYAFGNAYGMYTYTNGEGTNTMTNSGVITVTSEDSSAYGIRGNTSSAGAAYMYVDNSGTITVVSNFGTAYGVYVDANGIGADIFVDNSGQISATGYGYTVGIGTDQDDYGAQYVDNSGTIVASSTDGNVYGVRTSTDGSSDFSYTSIDNSGSISANSLNGNAYGAYAYVGSGDYTSTNFDNSGTLNASTSYGDAAGIFAHAYGYEAFVGVDNSGNILADGYGQASGIVAMSDDYGVVDVNNTGVIDAYASNDGNAQAYGILVDAYDSYVYNGNSVYAYANGGNGGLAHGIDVDGYYTDIVLAEGGYTGAVAIGSSYAIAEGANVSGQYLDVSAEGEIYASTSAGGFSSASGIRGFSNGYADIYVGGDAVITATAVSDDYAQAYGVFLFGYHSSFTNEGEIHASVDGVEGYAYGAKLTNSAGDTFEAWNYGEITAEASGDEESAVGVRLNSNGDIYLYNSGTISATSDYYATGVWLSSGAYTETRNYGLIEADGGWASIAIRAINGSSDYVDNQGTINGAIWSYDGDDTLYNGVDGTWNPGSTYSDFGDGDDGIWNYGVINMDNSVIDLGYHDVTGNYFYNYGTINVSGDENYIHMGHGPAALVPSLNPNPFYNGVGGVIDFQDGAPDDKLTIIGDFAGDGDINVDVSGLDEVSDVLYIDGSVVTGTAGVINVDLLDLPDTIEALIPIVYVTGNSVSGNFVLGEVNWDDVNTFVTLDFDIVADIDATNATPDVFALGIQVTGLSDPGTLAASIPGAVQSLMNSQVGTWRQRMGVIDNFNDGAISLWARIWTDKGGWAPEHNAGNFGNGGNFDWDQKNSGVEAGLDFAVTDEFSLGLLVAKSQADVDLADPGHGSADLDADTWGIYGTWISPTGFYLDASYRWMSFDVDLNSIAGPMQADGDAESFNLELGYAWTLSGGLKIEPQFQYTKTSVDSMDALVTTTNMQFVNDGGDSSRGRVGVAFRKSFGEADAGWLWTPYLTISAVREFDGENQYAINGTFFGETDLEGTSALLELGFTARHQNWSIYGGLNWQDGGAVDNWFGGQLGVRYTFGGPAPVAPPPPAPPAKTCADLDDDGDGINNCDDKCVTPSGEAVGADGCPLPPAPEPAPEPKPYRG